MSQIIVLAILILINAFFAATEIAFISLNDAKIEKQAKEGNKKAKQIKKMLREPSKFLATIQIGITLAGFLSSAFAADAFADDLAPMLQNLIPLGLTAWRNISIILITIILSYFSLIFGELVPKRLAMRNSEKIAFGTIGIIRTISIITAPFVKLLTASTNGVSKLFGISGTDEETVTEEEIRMMVDVGEEKGSIKEEERELINNVFEFNDKVVSEIMIHRKDIYAIDINSDIDNILKELDEYKYSRIPVYEENIDNIVGMLFIKDLLANVNKKEKVKIAKIIREPYFVSENKPIDELFRDLQKNKHQLAIVLDEYGGTAGLVTMEDIIEELVGNIFDEYDEEEKEFEKIDDNTFLISGSVSIHDLRKILGVEIPEGEYDTLSGYLIELLGRIPSDDEKPVIETKRVTYKIEDYEEKRILWVKACRNNVEEDNDDESDEEDSKTSKEDTEKSED
ncbi:cBS domain-containing protein [Clostridium sp. CAG:452]|nr:cBS domain-containing protein [Clostridium sp. CAG:452]